MSKKTLVLFCLLITTHVFALPENVGNSPTKPASLSVKLIEKNQVLEFPQSTRLDYVLKSAQEQNVQLQYSLATTIFDVSNKAKQKSSALKSAVLNQMIQHNLISHPFYKFIRRSQFSPRLLSMVDQDQARLNKLHNPRLKGQLALSSPSREEKVLYIGNVDKIYSIKNLPGVPLFKQIEALKHKGVGALPHTPILIYPDGSIEHPQKGNWLTKQYYLPPLTMVYIPFEEFENSKMDQDIVKLLAQRIPASSKKLNNERD